MGLVFRTVAVRGEGDRPSFGSFYSLSFLIKCTVYCHDGRIFVGLLPFFVICLSEVLFFIFIKLYFSSLFVNSTKIYEFW